MRSTLNLYLKTVSPIRRPADGIRSSAHPEPSASVAWGLVLWPLWAFRTHHVQS